MNTYLIQKGFNLEIRELTEIDSEIWKLFIKEFDEHNFFHSPEILKIFNAHTNHKPFIIAAMDNSRILALATGILTSIHIPIPRKIRSRLIFYASPLYHDTIKGREGLNKIFSQIKEIGRRNALFIEIRNNMQFPTTIFDEITSDWEYIPYQNFMIDLSVGPKAVWNSFSTYARNKIYKSKKNGVEIKHIHDSSALESFELIRSIYTLKKIPMLPEKVFSSAVAELISSNILQVINAVYDGQIIATRWGLAYGKILYDWYAGTDYNFSKLYPNELLSWKMMEWGANNGYKTFDFGGAGIKGEYYGPAKFKEKFHGKLVEYGRYRYIPNKSLYNIASKLYEWRIGIKSY